VWWCAWRESTERDGTGVFVMPGLTRTVTPC
jgi:hypothetical protein